MKYITLSQQKKPQNLYFYPLANYSVDFTPVGEATNYLCVNDTYQSPDDDSTYVYSQSTSLATDIYNFYGNSSSTILRPVSDDEQYGTSYYGASERWDCVDDITPDDSSSYIYFDTGVTRYYSAFVNTFSKPYSYVAIEKIVVTGRVNAQTSYGAYCKIYVKVNGTKYYSDTIFISYGGWRTKSATWTTNPSTGHGWTWEDIQNLIIGWQKNNGSDGCYLTQLYVTVYYKEISSALYYNTTINYVKFNARASLDYMIPTTGEYKITFYSGGTYYYSNNFYIGASYYNYNKIWITNPSTSTDWTWDDIASLQAGITCKSDYGTGGNVEDYIIYRPIGDSSVNLETYPSGVNNYTCVDEATADNWNTYVYVDTSSTWITDDYNLSVGSSPTGYTGIKSVVLFLKLGTDIISSPYSRQGKGFLNISGTKYYTDTWDISYGYNLYSYTWATNPSTSTDWTWSDIQNLIIGVALYNGANIGKVACTQIYLKVNYYRHAISKVKTTQFNVTVNYTPEESTCSLPAPETVERYNERTINMLNFWNGDREVYDLSRSRKGLILKGKLWGSSATDTIECIRQMGLDGSNVTVSGFEHNFYNGTYKIKSFGWQKIFETPLSFEWILELEDVS